MAWLLLAAARDELHEQTLYYLSEGGEALASRFEQEIAQALALLETAPMLGTPAGARRLAARGVRLWPLRRFPFNLVYRTEARQQVLIALAHQRRSPGYWTGRR